MSSLPRFLSSFLCIQWTSLFPLNLDNQSHSLVPGCAHRRPALLSHKSDTTMAMVPLPGSLTRPLLLLLGATLIISTTAGHVADRVVRANLVFPQGNDSYTPTYHYCGSAFSTTRSHRTNHPHRNPPNGSRRRLKYSPRREKAWIYPLGDFE